MAGSLPEELVREILTWLPAKSLMRFKCVSKLWKSIILDPLFARAYRGGFRGILLSQPSHHRPSPTKNFSYLDFFADGDPTSKFKYKSKSKSKSKSKQIAHHHAVVHDGGRRLWSTEIVNGLVCFYYETYSCLYNIATRECRDLPASHFKDKSCRYHLGFDPVNKLYKLLKICTEYKDHHNYHDEATLDSNLYCEILIIGIDMSWRIIDPAPWKIIKRSVCHYGILYWLDDEDETGEQKLIAFHLNREKFEFVPMPQDFMYPARFGPGLTLIAVIQKGHSCRAEIFAYDNNNDNGVWRWVDGPKFSLPRSENSFDHHFFPTGVLPDGQVFLIDYFYSSGPFYLYDPVEKKLTRIVIHGTPSDFKIFDSMEGQLSYYEDNIISLSCLTI